MTTNKTLLNNYIADIQISFNRFKDPNDPSRRYMFVYFTNLDKPWITFSNTNNPSSTMSIGGMTLTHGYTYDTTQDFTTQTNNFS